MAQTSHVVATTELLEAVLSGQFALRLCNKIKLELSVSQIVLC
jgi:hypothetical protein